MKTRPKAPAAVLRGIVIHTQPHTLARPSRSAAQAPGVKVHALPPSPRGDIVNTGSDHKALQQQAFAKGREEGYAAGRTDAHAETQGQLQIALDAARARAVDEWRAQGLKEGLEAASAELEHARKLLLEETAAETRSRKERLERLLSGIESQAAKALSHAEDDLVALAHDVICRMLGAQAVAPETIRAEVKSLLAQYGARSPLAVHVHPDDLAALEATGGDGDPWGWVADHSVQLGGMILRSPDGSLDARLENQLAALKEALLRARAQRRADYLAAASLPAVAS